VANRDEVEEFLRRAAARRAAAQQQQQQPQRPLVPPQQQQQGWPPPQPAPPQQPFQPRPAAQYPPQPYAPQPVRRPASLAEVVILEPAPPPLTLEAEVVEAELADQPDRLGRYVAQDLRGAQEISEHTRQLGAEVDQADDKLEARLHQVFDHSVGQLKKQATDSIPKTPEAADAVPALTSANLAELMRSPPAIRSAIVLGEILHRPEERW
jgi:hypothetical protein